MIRKIKRLSTNFAKVLFIIWVTTLVSFFIILVFNKDGSTYTPIVQKLFLADIITGVISFALMCFFALLGYVIGIFKPKSEIITASSEKTSEQTYRKRSGIFVAMTAGFSLILIITAFLYGNSTGLEKGIEIGKSSVTPIPLPTISPTPVPQKANTNYTYTRVGYSGPELWEAVNKRRIEHGVGGLSRSDTLCPIASARLNQLLGLGKLDNHAGFYTMRDDPNSPSSWVFKKYNISEFLVYIQNGSALDAVNLWDNTMGHQILLRGGQFTLGCTYAQNGFGVGIVAY